MKSRTEGPVLSKREKPRTTPQRVEKYLEKSLDTGPVLVVCGEPSGDLLAGDVIQALKRSNFKEFFGTGGSAMLEQGAELIENVESLTIIGFVEALRNYRRLKALARKLVSEAANRGARTAILVDYPGFNLRLAPMLKAAGIKVIFLVSPQLWAWHKSRINSIRKNVDLMLTLFDFEKRIYDEAGVKCDWVGHPLIRRIPEKLSRELPIVSKRARTIALMPGSRRSEIAKLLPPMLDAARILSETHKNLRFLLPNINEHMEPFIKDLIAANQDLKVEYLKDQSLRVLEAADAVIIASGTATLEAAYFMKPMVIVYRTGWINLIIATALIRTRYVGLVNILAGKQAVMELLQTEVTPTNIADEIARILDEDSYRRNMIAELEGVRKSLGSGNPADKAAKSIIDFLRSAR